MTCVSLKSGRASRGTLYMDQMPTATAKPINKKTSALLADENSMMRPIILVRHPRHFGMIGLGLLRSAWCTPVLMARHAARGGFELAFGIDQKRSGGHDALIHLQTPADFDAVSEAISDLNGARFKISIAAIDEYGFANARIHHRIGRHREPGCTIDVKIDVDKHFRLQALIRIRGLEA